jgi:hypothetical protein
MITLRLTSEVHCRIADALRATEMFALLYENTRSAALGKPGIELVCEAPVSSCGADARQASELLFVHWTTAHSFQVPTLHGLIRAAPHGLTTTIEFEAAYEREIGLAGALFDWCVGRKLAANTLRAFFERLVRFVENEAGLERLLRRLLDGGKFQGRT